MDRTSALQLTTVSVPLQLPVFCCDLSAKFQTELSLAKEAVQELQISHSSSYKSHLLNAKLVPLTELVLKLAKKASKETLSCDLDSINVDLFTADCWCAVYEESDETVPHNHFPSDFSAVVYLEAEDDSAPIIFANSILVKPVSGSLVLFPGILQHHVPPTKGRRVIVAMNIFKVPRFKNQDQ